MKNNARFYACPYCLPCAKAHLEEDTMEVQCDHPKGLFKSNKKCKEEQYKCKTKKVMKCKKCKETFLWSKKFLKEQLRKLKDG